MPLRFSSLCIGTVVAQFSNEPYHAVEVGTLKLKRRLTSGYQSRVRRRGCQKAQLALSLAARYLADEVWAVRVPNRNAVAVIRRAVERRPNAQQARCLNDRRSTHHLSQGAKTIGTPRRALGARTINRHESIRFGPFGSIRLVAVYYCSLNCCSWWPHHVRHCELMGNFMGPAVPHEDTPTPIERPHLPRGWNRHKEVDGRPGGPQNARLQV